ncbi:urease accessory protein UreD [Mycobacterium sp. C31M]
MRTEVLLVARADRSPHVECTGGITARRTAADTVHLLSAVATPLGGDDIVVRIVVEPGATLRVRSVAASVALPSATTIESCSRWDLEVHGELDVDAQPTLIAASSRHLATTTLRLGADARTRVRERVQIGRAWEREGYWTGLLHADVAGTPLLRHRVELGTGSVADDRIAAPRACISELRYPDTDFDCAGTLLPLAAGGALATWQGERL